ncbi:uncharacterized protein DS421_1g11750 [Arachis hypogaea]|nr:uncharacterized protein DS421_1g11750 [Arachis hypogaea]
MVAGELHGIIKVAVAGVTTGGGGEGCITVILAPRNSSVATRTIAKAFAVWFSHYSFVTLLRVTIEVAAAAG